MGQDKKETHVWNLLLNDEEAFQKFIKTEFEKGNIYFDDEIKEIIERAIAAKNKLRGVKVPNKQELLDLFLVKFREKDSIHGAATLVVQTKFFRNWVKVNNKTFNSKTDSYGREKPGDVEFIFNLATNHFGPVEDIRKYIKLIDSNKYQDLLDEFELGWNENEYKTYE
jgi:hypothetical protein